MLNSFDLNVCKVGFYVPPKNPQEELVRLTDMEFYLGEGVAGAALRGVPHLTPAAFALTRLQTDTADEAIRRSVAHQVSRFAKYYARFVGSLDVGAVY